MDRRRAFLTRSGLRGSGLKRSAAGLLFVLAACAGAPQADAPLTRDSLRVLRWIAPGADRVRAMTTQPVACRAKDEEIVVISRAESGNQRDGWSVIDVGRIAFESPALLGGAAARMGLSCSSCHLNGRDNPDFFVEGVSAAPGTADVTNSLFSTTRGNGAFDPKPIPDIAARDGKQIKDRTSAEFRTKVYGLIAEEFDGQAPSPAMLGAVIAYMDGMVPCPDPTLREPVTAQMDIDAARKAFRIAQDDAPGADQRLMARAARERLERLNERFIAAGQADVRAALLDASQQIATWIDAPDAANAARVEAALTLAETRVTREASRSLYAPEILRAALGE